LQTFLQLFISTQNGCKDRNLNLTFPNFFYLSLFFLIPPLYQWIDKPALSLQNNIAVDLFAVFILKIIIFSLFLTTIIINTYFRSKDHL